ncbi:MAG: hypothetical protein JSU68_11200 [Phycisphaerales bacterium]|nr:MAG: hypothetical protein JSU68_11200 [Phycisphaerales bacterium]
MARFVIYAWILGSALVPGCGPAILSADDALAREGNSKVRLMAYVEQEPVLGLRRDVEDVRVRFYVDGREVGDDETDRDGRADDKCRLPDGTARRFEARARVEGRDLRSRGNIYTWRRNRTIIAVDVDNTLAETEYKELILEDEDDESDPLKRSRKVLNRLAEEYQILYLTARPRFLLDKTREWLDEEDFPPGPVVTAKGIRQAARPEEFKRKSLEKLRDDWPNLLIGIGDKASDAEAYGANKMLAVIVGKDLEPGIGPHAVVLRDWKRVDWFFEANRAVLSNPEELKDLIDDHGMLQVPLYPWRDD